MTMDRVDTDWGTFSTQVLHLLLLCTCSEFCGPRFHFIGRGHYYTCDSLSTIEVHFAKVKANDYFFEGVKETQWCLSDIKNEREHRFIFQQRLWSAKQLTHRGPKVQSTSPNKLQSKRNGQTGEVATIQCFLKQWKKTQRRLS